VIVIMVLCEGKQGKW